MVGINRGKVIFWSSATVLSNEQELGRIPETYSKHKRSQCPAMKQVTLQCPNRKTIKLFLWKYTTDFLCPRLTSIALPLVVAYGAALCIDFSACDCRQLRRNGKGVGVCISCPVDSYIALPDASRTTE